MTDTEKLDIRRKVCEVLYPSKDVRIEHENVWICDREPNGEGWQSKRAAQELESDNGKALDALDKFCKARGWRWILATTLDGRAHCTIDRPTTEEEKEKRPYLETMGVAHEWGEIPSTAICLAIIASAEGQK